MSMVDDGALAAVLGRLEQRLERLERKVDALADGPGVRALDHAAARLPLAVDAAATVAQHAWDAAEKEGIDPIGLYTDGLPVAMKAMRPGSIAMVDRLLSKMDDLDFFLTTIDKLNAAVGDRAALADRLVALTAKLSKPEMIALVETLVDRADDARFLLDVSEKMNQKLAAAKLDRAQLADRGLDLAVQTAAIVTQPNGIVGKTSTALAEVQREGAAPVGPFAALGALFDGNVQKAVGVAIAVAKKLGASL